MTAAGPTPQCLDAETLAAFAEGRLKRSEIPRVIAHLDACRDCRESLQAANDEIAATASTSRRWWIPAAGAAAVAAALLVVFGVLRPDSRSARLVELAPKSARAIEPRISGGFDYAPYRGPLRASTDARLDAEQLKLAGVVGELVETADRSKTPEAQRDAGVALLLVNEPADAMTRLRAAATDARGWSDLAAATYATAIAENRPALYAEALAAADRALQLDGALAEALFNRALILERLGRADDARAAWQRYLEVDATSAWAGEARRHLARATARAASRTRSRSPLPRPFHRRDTA